MITFSSPLNYIYIYIYFLKKKSVVLDVKSKLTFVL